MKSKFMAGLIASIVSLAVVVGAAILLTTVLDLDSENRAIYVVAIAVIALWSGIYKWLKPKETEFGQNNERSSSTEHDSDSDIPVHRS